MTTIQKNLKTIQNEMSAAYECDVTDIRLEEFERNGNQMLVSFLISNTNPLMVKGGSLLLGQKKYTRIYKQFNFNADGSVKSMKMSTYG
jgi:hypothetical protein